MKIHSWSQPGTGWNDEQLKAAQACSDTSRLPLEAGAHCYRGDYWLGSTWAPTNYAAIKGFQRAGRLDLAREAALRHLRCMFEVLEATGHIWENYCSEKSERGSWSGPNYCWSALGPIALLFETLIGLEPNALRRSLR